MRRAGWWVRMAPKGDRHWLDLAGLDNDGWWDSRPGALRSPVKRKANKGVVDIALFTAIDVGAWVGYEKLSSASWKTEGGHQSLPRACAKDKKRGGLGTRGEVREQH